MPLFISRSRAGIEALCQILANLESNPGPVGPQQTKRKVLAPALSSIRAKVTDIREGRKRGTR